eukprot:Trichotokara_eunicae@DN5869_c0_g4_i1.p1
MEFDQLQAIVVEGYETFQGWPLWLQITTGILAALGVVFLAAVIWCFLKPIYKCLKCACWCLCAPFRCCKKVMRENDDEEQERLAKLYARRSRDSASTRGSLDVDRKSLLV